MRIAWAAAVLLTAVILAFLLSGSGGSYKMKAAFDDVRGLIPGAAVRAGAVSVGSVESVELDGDTPVVTMRIDEEFVLHEGATADIQLFSNAGAVNRTIELEVGDTRRPRLPEGTTMKGERTDQPVNFDDATEVLNPPTRDNIRQLLSGLDAAVKGRGRDFDRTLRRSSPALNETANLLAQVNSDGAALKTLVRQGRKVTSALASSPGDLATAADRTAELLTVTAGRQEELARSVQRLGPALARGRTALASLAAATPGLRRLVAGLGPVAGELGPVARALRPALRSAGPFLDETRRLVASGPENLRDFRPIIASAQRVAPGLGELIDRVLPLGNTLRAYIPETVGLFQNLGASAATYDANGHLINITGGLFPVPPGSASATELGPGQCSAGRLKLPFTRLPGASECLPWETFEDSFIGVQKDGG